MAFPRHEGSAKGIEENALVAIVGPLAVPFAPTGIAKHVGFKLHEPLPCPEPSPLSGRRQWTS